MRLSLKVGHHSLFLTTFDFTIIFHLKHFTLPCLVSSLSAQPHICDFSVFVFFFHFDILY